MSPVRNTQKSKNMTVEILELNINKNHNKVCVISYF